MADKRVTASPSQIREMLPILKAKPGDVFADRGGRHLKHGWRRCAKPQGTILLRGASVDPVDENAM